MSFTSKTHPHVVNTVSSFFSVRSCRTSPYRTATLRGWRRRDHWDENMMGNRSCPACRRRSRRSEPLLLTRVEKTGTGVGGHDERCRCNTTRWHSDNTVVRRLLASYSTYFAAGFKVTRSRRHFTPPLRLCVLGALHRAPAAVLPSNAPYP